MMLNEILINTYGNLQQLERYEHALEHFNTVYGRGEVLIFRAPGRVNLIGEHTDYNQGFVMPVALDKDTVLLLRPRQDQKIRLSNIEADFVADDFLIHEDVPESKEIVWTNYARGVAQVLQQHSDHPLLGFDGLIVAASPSGVPRGAGLSSSSSLTVVILLGLMHLNEVKLSLPEVVQLASNAEWYVGTRGGIMDQYISLQGKKDHALFLDCKIDDDGSYRTEHFPLMTDYYLLIVDSGVKHQNVGGGYNYRVAACRAGTGLLKQHFPQIKSLRDVQDEPWHRLEQYLPERLLVSDLLNQGIDLLDIPTITPEVELTIKARCQHVYTENKRVLEAAKAMQEKNAQRLGDLLSEAHASARDNYEISCSEIEALIAILNAQEAVLGARLTGAGWGGCVVALVRKDAIESVTRIVKEAYKKQVGFVPGHFVSQASSGASFLAKLAI